MGVAGKMVCLVMVSMWMVGVEGEASWCVAKIDASEEALQRALDSACGAAQSDCIPIQPNGLCYIPNTLQAHASYAFNTFYQRNARAPHACYFHGTSTIAQTDPSYGSCVYPSSASDGVTNTTTVTTATMNNPNVTTTPTYAVDGAGSGLTPPLIPENSGASSEAITASLLVFLLILLRF